MHKYRTIAALLALLALAVLIPGASAMVACPGVAPGETVTFEGPDPVPPAYVDPDVYVYYYQWTAEANGATIDTGTDQSFKFTVPDVPSGAETLHIDITLLVTDGYGCINEASDCLTAYAGPPCGISGDDSICEDSPETTYSYAEDPSGLTFAWKIDGVSAGTGDSINVDWTGKSFGTHVVALEVTKTYGDDVTTKSTCTMNVLYIQSPDATFTRVT
jgi:hypothetical protein